MTPHSVVVDYFDPPDGQPSPVLLALPLLGGANEVAQIEEFNPIFKQIVLDHKRVIDWIQPQEGLDPQRIGLFGISAVPPGF